MQSVSIIEAPVHIQTRSTSLRTGGTVRQTLLTDNAADGLNFRFIRSQYQGGDAAFESPRHHHAFQQLRFTESGSVNYAPNHDIPAGDLAYFPRGAYYGPQRKDHGAGMLLQFGFHGEHQAGPEWAQHRATALARLNARGRFDAGVYYERDSSGAEHTRDANQALYEEQYLAQTGQTFLIPPEGYAEPILMHHDAFEYYQIGPGVRAKQLGHFFDHPGPCADIRISMLELTDSATHPFTADRAQLAWTLDAGLQVDERPYAGPACFYSRRGETTTISVAPSATTVELYIVELPRLD
jgi:hypothetical protein